MRDGKRALELAQKAQQLEDKPSAFVLEALAAAYAEVGDFDRAVASEKEAIELAKSYGGTDGHKFVNGVLDKLAATLRADEMDALRRDTGTA